MEFITAYLIKESARRFYAVLKPGFLIQLTLLLILNNPHLSAQEQEYDEISIRLEIPRAGAWEIDAAIKGTEVYLPVTDLFDFLRIRNVTSPGLEMISGFFINPEAEYVISRTDNTITYEGKIINLEPGDLLRTESNLYLRSLYFGRVFGLDCAFSFRTLSVKVTSKLELPYIREMRLEEMRRNLTRLRGEVEADTNVGRTYPLFRFGMADWSVVASEEINGKSDARLNLNLGAMLAGGEATASLNYNTTGPFNTKQQYYLWRYVNNDFAPMRQVMAGKIATNALSTIYNPVIGVQLTNTPTTYRRSFGSYTLSDMTEPGWIVELYVNNILVNYVKADASGFYKFEVPLVYGNSMVKLKFYGPWGEERTKEQNINIPFNFLPHKTMEYRVSAGIVEDTLASRFSRADVKYGVTRSITVGGGAEYLSSISSAPFMPFVNASVRITNNLLLTGEYTYGVRAKSSLILRLPSNLQFDLNYTWYDKDQKAIRYNYREERKAMVSMPLRFGRLSTYQRLSLYQILLPTTDYTTGEWLMSGSLSRVSANLTTYALLLSGQDPYLYSNLSLSFRLPARFVIRPQAQYSYTRNEFLSARLGVEKHIGDRAFLNMSYEQNFVSNLRTAELGIRYDFSFAQTGASIRQADKKRTLVQYARGSLINDGKTKYLGTDNRTNVGKGGISVVAFFDLNANGKRDPGEPKAAGLNLRAQGGRVERSDRDTTIRILGLEPYTDCFIELDPNSFDNISWRLTKQTYSVAVDPNILKLVEIPVMIAGEASGTVTLERDGVRRGLGRVIVNFMTETLKPAGRVLTEDDGYFSFFELPPGRYSVNVDTGQLRKLNMVSEPESLQFEIKPGIDGDFVDGLDFNLKVISVDTLPAPPVMPEEPVIEEKPVIEELIIEEPVIEAPVVKTDTLRLILHELTEEVYTITEDSWAIQIGAFRDKAYAEGFRKRIEEMLGKEVQITMSGDFYRVRVLDLNTREEVDKHVKILNENGFNELWIIRLLARQQQRLYIPREDTVITTISTRIFDDRFYKLKLKGAPFLDQPVVDAIEKQVPADVGRFELMDAWLAPVIAEPEEEPAVVRYDISLDSIRWQNEIEPYIEYDTTYRVTYDRLIVPPAPAEPAVALQVAIFHNRNQALRAQRRITQKLDLPVEIVERWDNYYVIVTGFFTREQTYRYYPELAAIGYPRITLIENYKRP
jgi:hypothetical protein